MTDGFDFDQEVNSLEWENIEEKEIRNELLDVVKRCNETTKQLSVMIANNECKKTEDALESFAYGDLGANGWISDFHLSNQDSFSKYINGNDRPSWYRDLGVDRQKKYDMVMKYYKDTVGVMNPMNAISKILLELVDKQNLREGFRLIYMKSNLEDAGIDEKTFKTLEVDALQVSKRINQNWGDAENMAKSARDFLEKNREKMDFNSLKTGYQKARLKDYIDDFKNSVLSSSFSVLPEGSFYIKADILSKVRIIDRYTFMLAQMEYIEDVMKKLQEQCKEILNKQLLPYEKNALTEEYGNVSLALRKLCQGLIDFAETALETFKLYKDADPNKSPYCFMGKLSAYSTISRKYALDPSNDDPWDKGTKFTELYTMEAASLTQHCEDFVRKQGNADLRD